jgi:WD40 repeat protein
MAGAVAVCDLRTGRARARLGSERPLIAAFWDEDAGRPAVLTVDDRGVVRRWRLESASEFATMADLGYPARELAFDGTGDRIAVGALGATHVYDVATRRLLGSLPVTPRSIEFDPSSRRLLTASKDAGAQLWDLDRFELIRTLFEHGVETSTAHFSRDGSRIVIGCFCRLGHVLDAESGERLVDLRGHSGDLRSAFHCGKRHCSG